MIRFTLEEINAHAKIVTQKFFYDSLTGTCVGLPSTLRATNPIRVKIGDLQRGIEAP